MMDIYPIKTVQISRESNGWIVEDNRNRGDFAPNRYVAENIDNLLKIVKDLFTLEEAGNKQSTPAANEG